MPGRLYEGELTVPAGTLAAAPVSSVMQQVPDGTVTAALLTVPDGHAGLTGFQLVIAGTPVMPHLGGWIVANGEKFDVPLDQDVAVGQVMMQGYNTDIFAHTFYLRILWHDGPAAQPVLPDLAISAPAMPELGAIEQIAQPPATPTAAAPAELAPPVAPCFDAAGNLVPCDSPAATLGPVQPLPRPLPAAPAAGIRQAPPPRPATPLPATSRIG